MRRPEEEMEGLKEKVLAYLWRRANVVGSQCKGCSFVFVRGSEVCEHHGISPPTWRRWLDEWFTDGVLEYEAIHGNGTKIWLAGEAPCET